MKGTLFSADFVYDSNDSPRLIEINTDTSFIDSVLEDHIDFDDFKSVLSTNNITNLHVLYKGIHTNFVNKLEDYISLNAPFITLFSKTEEDSRTLYPTVIYDQEGKFILRLCYDESAIFDSKYAKTDVNTLGLFVNNNDTGSVVPFFHSSSLGEYNTLKQTFNSPNIPDFAVKKLNPSGDCVDFLKVGKSTLSSEERINELLSVTNTEKYFLSNFLHKSIDNYTLTGRSFQIIYGSELKICNLGEYKIKSLLDLPSEIDYSELSISNTIDYKHFYEFATNDFKSGDGISADTKVVKADGTSVEVSNLFEGQELQALLVSGSPDTDDTSVVNAWYSPGNTLPSGSTLTTSEVVALSDYPNRKRLIHKVELDGGNTINMGGTSKVLTYDSSEDKTLYKNLRGIGVGDTFYTATGDSISINAHTVEIWDEDKTLFHPNLEPVDTFIISGSNTLASISVVVHNVFGCFTADSKVEMFDGSLKNIIDIEVGDLVKSSYKGETVPGKVTEKLIHPVNKVVEISSFNNITSDRNHPILYNGEWIPACTLPFAVNSIGYVDNFYNLEIDGDTEVSEHNYYIGKLPASGLGDNKFLNYKYKRQSNNLLKHL